MSWDRHPVPRSLARPNGLPESVTLSAAADKRSKLHQNNDNKNDINCLAEMLFLFSDGADLIYPMNKVDRLIYLNIGFYNLFSDAQWLNRANQR